MSTELHNMCVCVCELKNCFWNLFFIIYLLLLFGHTWSKLCAINT
jgi:hypothetical protein